MAKLKFTETDAVIIGIGGLILTFVWYLWQAQQKPSPQPGAHKAANPNAGKVQQE